MALIKFKYDLKLLNKINLGLYLDIITILIFNIIFYALFYWIKQNIFEDL
jgi:hypothetical protein